MENNPKVFVRSHRGSGQRIISREDLWYVSHLPQADAAAGLGIGATRFKSILRQLGLTHWPYRPMRSLSKMIKAIQILIDRLFFATDDLRPSGGHDVPLLAARHFDRLAVILKKLVSWQHRIFKDPSVPLSTNLKRMRSLIYKLGPLVASVQHSAASVRDSSALCTEGCSTCTQLDWSVYKHDEIMITDQVLET